MSKKDIVLILDELMVVKGVVAVALVQRDGGILESVSCAKINMDGLGTMVATAVGTSETLVSEFSHGKFEMLLCGYANGKIILVTVLDEVLVVIADKAAVIANVRYTLEMNMQDLIRALQ